MNAGDGFTSKQYHSPSGLRRRSTPANGSPCADAARRQSAATAPGRRHGSISTFRFADGALERLAVTEGVTGCSTFAVDEERNLVYAAVKGEPAAVVTFSLDRESGRLEPQSRRELPGGGMNYLALTRDGAALLGASYGGGYGIICPVADGIVGAPVSRIAYPNLHSVIPSADGGFAYFVSLGADLVAQYAIADDLALVPLEPATAAAPAGG